MPKDSKRYHYKSVTLPEPVVERIKNHIEENPELGYSSITEFVKDAVRSQIKDNLQVIQSQEKD